MRDWSRELEMLIRADLARYAHAQAREHTARRLRVGGTGDVDAGAGDHFVHFYERDSALAQLVGGYLARAVQLGGAAIVIATEAHRRAFGARLAAAGIDLPRADGEQVVVWLDAAEVLARFMPAGGIDVEAFGREVGSLVPPAAGTGGPVRVYGEMVQLLWDAGMVVAALELEELWDDIVDQHHCSLMCAYRRSSVLGCEHARALQRVCELHSSVLPPLVSEVESRRSGLAALYRQVAHTLERTAELAERHASYDQHYGRQRLADIELERAKRARACADRGRELASRLERR
jgi:hypothetical protein